MLDLIIRGGKVVDGGGKTPLQVNDIGVKDGEITALGNLENEIAKNEIKADGKIVTPGFIDLNNHSDTNWTLFQNPDQESLLFQGITTIIGGNCGSSLAPIIGEGSIKSLRKWTNLQNIQIDWDRVSELLLFIQDNRPLRLNFGTLVGHATLRRGILEENIRPIKREEMETLKYETEKSLKEGAFGLSTGLAYTHAKIATQDEIMALAKIVVKNNGIFTVHLRGEQEDLISSLEEAIAIAEETGVNLEVSHLKAVGKIAWQKFNQALHLIGKARERQLNINFDVYPYNFSNPVLYTLLPSRLTEYNKELVLETLRDQRKRKEIIAEMQENSLNYSQIVVASSPLSKLLVRKNIAEIAYSRNVSPEEVVLDLVLASDYQGTVLVKLLSEKNVTDALSNEAAIVCSDGAGYKKEDAASGNLVHARCFGTFPRFLARYVKKREILSLPNAINKITGLPAKKIGLKDRGEIKKGYRADIVIWDWDKILDTATLERPFSYPEGIEYVIVNGEITAERGVLIPGVRSGEVLKKTG
ncbi:MAG: amidohydrolase family protein [Candidatus Moranbacteria bacterium]|nr:amidohydrolase family protein [Candidatus Moranbacteria bacterium]